MLSPIAWLAIFVVVGLISLYWATSNLARQLIYLHNKIEYPTHLEFNSSLAFLAAIVLTIITSVVVGHLVVKYIQPDQGGIPSTVTTIVVLLIWLVVLILNMQLVMRAKVVHLKWPDDKANEKIYPVGIATAVALSLLLTLSLATMSSTVVAILITQVVKAF